jgi:Acid Phosphatase
MYQIAGPPFRVAAGKVLDRSGTHIALYPAAKAILEELHTHTGFASTRVATASRTTKPS